MSGGRGSGYGVFLRALGWLFASLAVTICSPIAFSAPHQVESDLSLEGVHDLQESDIEAIVSLSRRVGIVAHAIRSVTFQPIFCRSIKVESATTQTGHLLTRNFLYVVRRNWRMCDGKGGEAQDEWTTDGRIHKERELRFEALGIHFDIGLGRDVSVEVAELIVDAIHRRKVLDGSGGRYLSLTQRERPLVDLMQITSISVGTFVKPSDDEDEARLYDVATGHTSGKILTFRVRGDKVELIQISAYMV